MVFLRILSYIVISIILGILYNKFIIKYFTNNKRKILCIITLVIFILSSISLSIAVSIKKYISSTIVNYSNKIEKFVIENNSNNGFVVNGIDLKNLNNNIIQLSNSIYEIKTIIPTHEQLNLNKSIYDMIIGFPVNELMNQLNNIFGNTVDFSIEKFSIFANNNNFITVSSILQYLNTLANKHVNNIFRWIFIILLVPAVIYILITTIIVIVKIIRN